jgi:hypothetical protein
MQTKTKIGLAVVTLALMAGAVILLRPWEHKLPVSISYRRAAFDYSLVAQIHNNSNATRKVRVTIESPTAGQQNRRLVIIPPRRTIEIGWFEGWPLVSGEQVRVHQYGYKDVVDVVE